MNPGSVKSQIGDSMTEKQGFAFYNPIGFQDGDPGKIKEFNVALQSYLLGSAGVNAGIGDLRTMSTDDLFTKVFPLFRRKRLGVILEFSPKSIKGFTDFSAAIGSYNTMAAQSGNFIFNFAVVMPTSESTYTDTNTLSASSPVNLTYEQRLYENTELLSAKAISRQTKDVKELSSKIYMRVYPQTGYILPPLRPYTTTLLSNNEILQVSSVVGVNAACALQNNLALNTVDTQWADMYTLFFNYWLEYEQNKSFRLIFGDYILPNCYFRAQPQMVQTLEPVTTFNLDIISGVRSINGIQVS